jgi:CrcB protein
MMTIAAVIIGAGVAAPLRFFIERRVEGRFPTAPIPVGLLMVNVIGSAIAGFVAVMEPSVMRTLLIVGFCGTLTTFSGFGWQVLRRWRTSRRDAWLTIAVVAGLSIAAFWLGLTLGETITST